MISSSSFHGEKQKDSGAAPGAGSAAATWLDDPKYARAAWKPYAKLARVDRPAGTLLLLYPCYWSIGMAVASSPQYTWFADGVPQLFLFGVGAFVMRSAGCTINDMWDKDFDGKVERTADRPIASGEISPFHALVFLGSQLTVGLGILCQLNPLSIALGASSMVLVVAYPLAKRFTDWPQLVLGATFNWGALLGWTAVTDGVYLPAMVPLYAGGIAWTMLYDTIYAHQDKNDDIKIGVRSSALALGDDGSKPAFSAFAAAMVASWALAGYAADMSWPYYVSLGTSALHAGWQISTVDLNDRENLAERFASNRWIGLFMFAGIAADGIV